MYGRADVPAGRSVLSLLLVVMFHTEPILRPSIVGSSSDTEVTLADKSLRIGSIFLWLYVMLVSFHPLRRNFPSIL